MKITSVIRLSSLNIVYYFAVKSRGERVRTILVERSHETSSKNHLAPPFSHVQLTNDPQERNAGQHDRGPSECVLMDVADSDTSSVDLLLADDGCARASAFYGDAHAHSNVGPTTVSI